MKVTVLSLAALLFLTNKLSAQVINEGFEEPNWTSFSTGAGATTFGSVVLPNSPRTSTMSYFTLPGSSSFTTALNTCNNSGTWYYSKANSQVSTKFGAGAHSVSHSIKISAGGYIITPITPAAVVNITFWASNAGGTMVAGLATVPSAGAPGYNTSTTAAPGAFTYATSVYPQGISTMQSYSFGGTFSGPCRFGIFNPGNTIYIDDIQVFAPTGTPPTITTNSTNAAITNALVSGTVTPGTLPLLASGIIWSTSPLTGNVTDTLQPKTKDYPASTNSYTDTATPLLASTLYYTEAYVIGLDGSFYAGQVLQLTTKGYASPVLTTSLATNVLSNKAIVGGVITDSGGLPISDKYIKYGTNSNSLTNTVRPTVNTGGASYSILISQLQPSTTYYYEACATNGQGTNCGKIESFTTGVAVPALSISSPSIDFGNIIYNINSPVISYTLTGANFPSTGGSVSIALSSTTGYILSFSPSIFSASPGNSLNINFNGSGFKKTVYVKFLTSNYGPFHATVTHTSNLVAAQDADVLSLTGNIIPSPDQLSNVGSEFWTGFAYHNAMKDVTTQFDTTSSSKGAHFSVFLAGGIQGDSVIVDLPGIPNAISFPRKVYVPAGGFVEVAGFPVGDGLTRYNATNSPDSRLYFTGVQNRGIHIYSQHSVPVSAWIYDWQSGDAAGGSMLFPTNTWNSSYIVQAIGGKANNGGYNNNSFFFVIAKDDNTVVTFKPTNDILDSNVNTIFTNNHQHTPAYVKYKKDTTYSIVLNKGQVFNAMGFVGDPDPAVTTDLGALDLSGTVISTTCDKKIAVFGGNGRCVLGTGGDIPQVNSDAACISPKSGSDNLVQQMFPKVAWGTEYLTVPTKNMSDNMFRVYVQDPTTNVTLNGTSLSKINLVNNLYYQFDVNKPSNISADKPISVTQFILSGTCGAGSISGAKVGNIGKGDPEMITLSPVQQSIKNVTVYSATFKNGNPGACYINVVVKDTSGVNSFKLDGLQSGIDTGGNSFTGAAYAHSALVTMKNAFKKHPGDGNYYYATFWVKAPAKHTLSSSQGFNAIAYGVNDGESYGYNAGTAINNLSSIKIAENPNGNDTSNSVVLTCKNNPVRLQIALPYLPSEVNKIVWSAPVNSNIDKSGTSFDGPVMTDPNNSSKQYADTSGSIVIGGETFYLYTCPVQYTFSDYGFYPMVATAYGTFASDCGGTDAQTIYVQVSADNIDFKVTKAGCTSTNVTITDNSTAMAGASIVKWSWDLGDNSPIQNYTDTANHNPTPNPHTYPALSSYTIKLTTVNNLGCNSVDSFLLNLAFGINAGFSKDNDTICPNGTVTFTDTSSATADKRVWDFGEPSSGANNTATYTNATNPSHVYTTPGKHIITLQVFSGVCPSNVFKDSIYVASTPKPDFTFKGVCLPGSTTFTNTSDFATGFSPYTYLWYFGDSTNNIPNTATTTDGTTTYSAASKNPNGYAVKLIATNRFGCIDSISHNVATVYDKPKAIVGSFTNTCFGDSTAFTDASIALKQTITNWNWDFGDLPVSTATNPKHKFSGVNSYNVKLSITTKEGCSGDTIVAVKINPLPVPSFVTPSSCLVPGGGSVKFTNTSTIADNTPLSVSWSYVQGGALTPSSSPSGDGQYTYATTGTFPVIQKVTSSNGCSAADTLQFQIAGSKPQAAFSILNANNLCSNIAVQLKDASTIGLGVISKIDIIWDAVNKPSTLATYNTPSVNTIYSNSYTVAPTDANYSVKLIATCGSSCSDTTKAQIVTVHGSPQIAFADQTAAPCANDKPIAFTPATETTGPTGGTWTYSGPGVNNTNNTFDPSAVSGGTTSTITAVYTTPVTPLWGCRDTAYSKISVKSIVDLSFSANTFSMCKGTTDSLQLNPISSVGQTFTWTESDAPLNTISDVNAKKPWVKPVSDSTVYTVIAQNPAYCTSSPVSVTVRASPYPTLSIVSPASKETTICFGDTAKLAVAPKAASITWTPVTGLQDSKAFSTIATPVTTTKYKIAVKDTFYCKKATIDSIIVFVQPQFAIDIVNDLGNDSLIIVPGDSIRLHAFVVDSSASFLVTYKWAAAGLPTDLKYLSSPTSAAPVFKPTEAVSKDNLPYIHYTVTATSKGGCHAYKDYAVKVFNALPDLLVPTVFINDGRMRSLTPVPVGITEVLYFRVYNRMGQLVYSTKDIGKGWDGMINGSPAEVGTYVWMAQGKDYKGNIHQPQTGTVVLLR